MHAQPPMYTFMLLDEKIAREVPKEGEIADIPLLCEEGNGVPRIFPYPNVPSSADGPYTEGTGILFKRR